VKLPNGHRALVDLPKLRDYCLSPVHLRGRHKARVFRSTLGLTGAESGELLNALVVAATEGEATLGQQDAYGVRYVLDFTMVGPKGVAVVRSHWLCGAERMFPGRRTQWTANCAYSMSSR